MFFKMAASSCCLRLLRSKPQGLTPLIAMRGLAAKPAPAKTADKPAGEKEAGGKTQAKPQAKKGAKSADKKKEIVNIPRKSNHR